MRVAIVQMQTKQACFEDNIQKAENFIEKAKNNNSDMIVFSEMFLTGFNYIKNKEFLIKNKTFFEDKIKHLSQKYEIAIVGSVPVLEDDLPSNRLVFANKTKSFNYDKIHLFGLFNEHKYVKAGNEIKVIDTEFGKIGLSICYDLRFPELYTKMTQLGAQIIIISAAWPYPRDNHWEILCKARAIENQAFVIAVNQVGTENLGFNEINYFGNCCVIDPWGEIIIKCQKDNIDEINYANIDLKKLIDVRSRISAQDDRRNDLYFS